MNRLIGFITKANQVLLFFSLIALGICIAYAVYNTQAMRYEPPHVQVNANPNPSKKAMIDDVRLLGVEGDIYAFALLKREVNLTNQGSADTMELSHDSSSRWRESAQMVNVNFIKDGKKVRSLIERDGLILSENFHERRYGVNRFKAELFLCATQDTDHNGILDAKDRNDLYIVDPGLNFEDIVLSGVTGFETIGEDKVEVKTVDGQTLHFFEIDVAHRTKKEIQWH